MFLNLYRDENGFSISLRDSENSFKEMTFNFPSVGLRTLKRMIDLMRDQECEIGQGCTLEKDGSSPNLFLENGLN